MTLFEKLPQLLFDQCMRRVGVVLSVDALIRQLLEVALDLGRRRDRYLDRFQGVFGPRHREKNRISIGFLSDNYRFRQDLSGINWILLG